MNNKLIRQIIDSKIPVFFVSPHLDDAVFSATNLILKLKNKTKVTVINVMTESNGFKSTFSAMKFVKTCGYTNAEDLFEDRRKEDTKIYNFIGVKKIDLGLVDATWRLKNLKNNILKILSNILPELVHIYPTFRMHVHGRGISHNDDGLRLDLKNKLDKLIPKNAIIFCPLSLGDHVDHVLVRNVVDGLDRTIAYWTDYPYLLENDVKINPILQIPVNSFAINSDNSTKEKLIKMYETQFNAMFPEGKVELGQETFYFSDKHKVLKNPTLTIGIPAYNEENNITNLLDDILKQKTTDFKLKNLLVFNDSSTDRTSELVQKYVSKYPWFKIIESKVNRGIANASNEIFKNTDDDICLLLNADIRIKDELMISKLINPIVNNDTALTSSKIVPVKSENYFSKILYFSDELKNSLFQMLDENSVYSCHGPARAFSKKLYKKIKFYKNYGDDMYSYIFTLTNGFKYNYVADSKVIYQMPKKLSEHIYQSLRFNVSIFEMEGIFGSDIVRKHFSLPTHVILLVFIKYFLNSPVYFINYMLMNIYIKYKLKFDNSIYKKSNWVSAESTKMVTN